MPDWREFLRYKLRESTRAWVSLVTSIRRYHSTVSIEPFDYEMAYLTVVHSYLKARRVEKYRRRKIENSLGNVSV